MGEEVSLARLLRHVSRRWKMVLAVAMAVTGGAAAYAHSLPDQYDATVVMAFAPQPTANISGDTVRLVLPKYVAYVTSRPTVNRIAATLDERPSILLRAVEATVAPESGNLTIQVELPSPERAAAVANALAADTLRFAGTDPILQAVIVAEALPDSVPSGPPRLLLEGTALIVGALVGATTAILLETGRPHLRTPTDVATATGYPVVGRIPRSLAIRLEPAEALEDLAVGAAIRTLRTNLEYSSRERPVHVLVVASSVPAEGKTTVAGLLAASLARLEAKVLLVDADLRRPRLASLFSVNNEPGLPAALRGEHPFKGCLRELPLAGLHLLPGSVDLDAGDLLARRFAGVLRQARERFDIVVVDAPPLLAGDDARTLISFCDAVLMVIGVETLATSVIEAASTLDALGVRVLGAVLNRVRDPSGLDSYLAYGERPERAD